MLDGVVSRNVWERVKPLMHHLFTTLKKKPIENILGKAENAGHMYIEDPCTEQP